ncbi:MAG TPA: cysteine desulfurase NifS, partial [Verrucomicrobiae bacterium]|nr:cysteine desulfurase NifS [Verrucomicrobiae bacterium]
QTIYYFDNNATTRVAPEVLEAMLPFLRESWGNPSSVYRFGKQVARHLESAREKVAALINAEPREIIFTSCGTESNNSAIHSALLTNPSKKHIVTTSVEHSANIKFCAALQKQGFQTTFLPVESDGALDLHLLEKTIRPDTAIVSVMWANNETGVIFPIEEIAAICRSKEVLFHTDAVQVAGKLKMDVRETGVDFLSLSAHKLHAPKGIGLLYVRRKNRYHPFVTGGGQENGRRGGTENVANIVAFGRAAEMAATHLITENARIGALRDKLENGILQKISGTIRNGSKESRLSNTTNISFDSVEAESVLLMLDQLGICASSGSACSSGSLDPSHVLMAMGCGVSRARSSVRFSLGVYNTEPEVNYVLEKLPPIIAHLRAHSTKAKSHSGETVAA